MAPTAEQWRAIEALFAAAGELPVAERPAYLDRACDDPLIRAEVERLLAHQPTSASFLEPPDREEVAARLASPREWVGQRLGDFVIEEQIGRGGMGVVFRARQLGLDRPAAIKVLDPRGRADPISAERFRREARAAARLEHPNIAPVLAFGDYGELSFYAMPLIEGWTLRELMDGPNEGGPDVTDPAFAARLVRDVADALHYAHGQGVIHRDVKPQNLLVTRDRHAPRLIDFGLAKVLSLDGLSRSGQMAGTPLYMSPEQILAEHRTVDHRTDVYSAGAVLYELLAGRPPFVGATLEQILYRITHERPRPIRAAHAHVPLALETVALKALRRDREDRYETAGELRDDLDRYLDGAPITARPPTRVERLRDALQRPRTWRIATPLLALGALSAGWWVAAPRQPTGRLSVALPAGLDAASATISRVDPLTDAVTPVAVDLALPIRGRSLAIGSYRIQVRAPGRGVSEQERALSADAALRLEPVVRPAEQVLEGMVRIPGGTYTVGLRGFAGGSYGESTRRVESFWIDVAEVSCARYREFLEAHSDVTPPWKEYDDAWDELPVVGVPWSTACRFAEWEGKRLPTWTEWQVAARGADALRFPWGDDPGDPARRAVVGRSDVEPWFSQVAAVDRAGEDRSPFGVLHMYGNVSEWTSSPKLETDGLTVAPHFSWRAIQGYGWSHPTHAKDGTVMDLELPNGGPENRSYIGLRCVLTDIE